MFESSIEMYARKISDALVKVSPVAIDDALTNIFSLPKVNEAVSKLRKSTIGRMIIDFSLT